MGGSAIRDGRRTEEAQKNLIDLITSVNSKGNKKLVNKSKKIKRSKNHGPIVIDESYVI